MGHAEVWWARGFKLGLIAVFLLWTASLLVTFQGNSNRSLRVLVYTLGVFVALVVPWVMVFVRPSVVIGGTVYAETHVGSIRYGFGVFFAGIFWLIDVVVSAIGPKPSKSLPSSESKPG